jgi:hypothetical protein
VRRLTLIALHAVVQHRLHVRLVVIGDNGSGVAVVRRIMSLWTS